MGDDCPPPGREPRVNHKGDELVPAKQARWMDPDPTSVNRDAYHPSVSVRDIDDSFRPIGPSYRVAVEDLPNAETYKAAAALGLTPRDYPTLDARREAITAALVAGNAWAPTNKRYEDPGVEEMEEGEREGVPCRDCGTLTTRDGALCRPCALGEKIPAPDPAPKGDAGDSSDTAAQLASLLTQLAGPQSIDADAVRAIVRDESAAVVADAIAKVSRPKVIHVTIGEREMAPIEGVQHAKVPNVLRAAVAGDPIMLVGPAGTGKSTIGEQVAHALGRPFSTMSVDPTMYRDVLFGFVNVHGDYVRTIFRDAYEHGHVFVLDEMDNGTASVLGGLNQALSNGGCGFPDGYVKRHADFVCIATANTYGTGPDAQYVGRSQLDAATLDRFNRITIGIDEEMEDAIAAGLWPANAPMVDRWKAEVRKVRARVAEHRLHVVVSPRATYKGIKLLAAGETWDEVAETVLYAGMTSDTRAKVGAK